MIEVINIEKKFKIKFINKNLLKNSLTHKSHDPNKNYEKLLKVLKKLRQDIYKLPLRIWQMQ